MNANSENMEIIRALVNREKVYIPNTSLYLYDLYYTNSEFFRDSFAYTRRDRIRNDREDEGVVNVGVGCDDPDISISQVIDAIENYIIHMCDHSNEGADSILSPHFIVCINNFYFDPSKPCVAPLDVVMKERILERKFSNYRDGFLRTRVDKYGRPISTEFVAYPQPPQPETNDKEDF